MWVVCAQSEAVVEIVVFIVLSVFDILRRVCMCVCGRTDCCQNPKLKACRHCLMVFETCVLSVFVQAIEIRLLGLGDEPLPPVMKTPVYLGNGKAKIEWSPGGMEFTNLPDATYVTPTADVNLEKDSKTGDATVTAPSFTAKELQAGFPKPKPASQEEPGLPGSEVREANEEYQQRHTPSSSAPSASGSWTSGYLNSESLGDATSPDLAAGSAGAVDRVYEPPLEGIEPAVAGVQGSCSSSAVAGDTAGKGRAVAAAQAERAATFPVHKYVLERSCLHVDASRASKSQHTSNVAPATNVNADASPSPNEGSAQAGPSSDSSSVVVSANKASVGGSSSVGGGGAVGGGFGGGVGSEGWVTVHSSSTGVKDTSFVDSGLLPGRTYVYR